jgi:hypothetical protein
MAKTNHGQEVSAFVHEQQDARQDGGNMGIGAAVSEFARTHSHQPPQPDFADGVITVLNADGSAGGQFTTFADALTHATDGATLEVGKGTYHEAINLDQNVTIVGENGAVLDGSGLSANTGTQGTIQLFDGFSGGSISGLDVIAVAGGNAVVSVTGENVNNVTLHGNTFDGGANTTGSVVYLNPGANNLVLDDNVFQGAALTGSPLLGVEADNVQVTNNTFAEPAGTYPEVEIFGGANGTTTDVALVGNTGLQPGDVFYG